uniref:hypothetical protein n=1 Tax=Malassezia psittaci TaxID=1821823 RepID=UPI003002F258|nr:hypothetical protein [Malassezia psittaci]
MSKNTTLCGKLLQFIQYFLNKIIVIYTKMNTNFLNIINYVKMSSTWGQSAWFIIKYIYINILDYFNKSSETTRSAFYSIFTKNTNLKDTFYKWFVGVTDSNGIFYFYKNKKGIWTFCFKVIQNKNNIQLFYYIKTMLKVGSIYTNKKIIVEFVIQDKKMIIKHILPIFKKYPLLTSKDFYYKNFCEAILISEDISISKEKMNNDITIINQKFIPNNFVSSAWKDITIYTLKDIISKEWIVGFTEVNSSFYLIKKGENQISHIFQIIQKRDKIIVDVISIILPIKVYNKKDYWVCSTTSENDVKQIICYFENTYKGIKSIEYRIWSRSFIKNLSFSQLLIIRNKIKNITNYL